jgi:hypothetical protein
VKLNPAVNLDPVEGDYVFAHLQSDLDSTKWEFLINPSTLDYGVSVGVSSTPLLGGSAPLEQFKAVEGQTLRLSEVLLVSSKRGSLEKHLTELRELVEAGTKVSFVWGKTLWGPAFVSSLSWKETEWVGGVATSATLSLELRKCGDVGEPPKVARETKLTERQRSEAKTKLGADSVSDQGVVTTKGKTVGVWDGTKLR